MLSRMAMSRRHETTRPLPQRPARPSLRPRPAGQRPRGLARHLWGLLLVALGPALLAGVLAAVLATQATRGALESRLEDNARALAARVDGAVEAHLRALQALAAI